MSLLLKRSLLHLANLFFASILYLAASKFYSNIKDRHTFTTSLAADEALAFHLAKSWPTLQLSKVVEGIYFMSRYFFFHYRSWISCCLGCVRFFYFSFDIEVGLVGDLASNGLDMDIFCCPCDEILFWFLLGKLL